MLAIRDAYAIYRTWGGTMPHHEFQRCVMAAPIGVERCMHLDNCDPTMLACHPETQKHINEDNLDPVILLLLPDLTLIAEGKYRFAAAYVSNQCISALMVVLDR